jgi:hypothetical protein
MYVARMVILQMYKRFYIPKTGKEKISILERIHLDLK